MIPIDFDYYRPSSIGEAVQAFNQLDSQARQPLYYGGGSEIVSMARLGNISTQAVIDLKYIPECTTLQFQGNQLVIGSCVTLAQISESMLFPLLGKTGGRIADHTMQCRITLGGNICGTIIYREAVLPLLLCDSQVVIAGGNGQRQVPLSDVFQERLQLNRGEFILQLLIDKEYLDLPYVHVKKTKNEKIDYPLVSVSAIKKENRIRAAFSGVCSFPIRSHKIEYDINDSSIPREKRADRVVQHLPAPVLSDISGSDRYRIFVLKETLINTMQVLEEA